jgi:hypothetical protein
MKQPKKLFTFLGFQHPKMAIFLFCRINATSDICQINPQNISCCSVVNSRIKNVLANVCANLNSAS